MTPTQLPELVAAILLIMGVLAFVGWPLLSPRARADSSPVRSDVLPHLHTERDSAYRALRDLDLEHQIGNISTEDYADLRGAELMRAAMVVRDIDALDVPPTALTPPSSPTRPLPKQPLHTRAIERRIEEDVALLRATRQHYGPLGGDTARPEGERGTGHLL